MGDAWSITRWRLRVTVWCTANREWPEQVRTGNCEKDMMDDVKQSDFFAAVRAILAVGHTYPILWLTCTQHDT